MDEIQNGHSRAVTSVQQGIHPRLKEIVTRHCNTQFSKKISVHTKKAFDVADAFVTQQAQPVVLDAGCGTGDSSRLLAVQHPDKTIIGVDKSRHRLGRWRKGGDAPNLLLLQAELVDFYRLIHAAHWPVEKHFILFPNPWPKPAHVMRRWHGAPVFPTILALGGTLELRTNWSLYAEEFEQSLQWRTQDTSRCTYVPTVPHFLSPFERKYHKSGHLLWRVTCVLKKKPDHGVVSP